jgi:sugar phosphate isomerase/epimerase
MTGPERPGAGSNHAGAQTQAEGGRLEPVDRAAALGRFSLNQRTTPNWSIPDLVDGCARAGLGAVGLWREPVAEFGLDRTAALVRQSGLRVSSLCRGGFLTDLDPDRWRAALDDNRRAIDEAATLGTGELVLVVGGLAEGSTDLPAARARLAEAVAVLAPEAGAAGVRLALEALHPMFCSDRSVLSTLDQALDLAAGHPPDQVGVVVDTYHLWWDPGVDAAIARAAGRISSFQVSDWVVPLPADVLLGRGLMGDGSIDLRGLRRVTEAAGYDGDIEVEIFNADLWAAEPAHVLNQVIDRYLTHVCEPMAEPVR